MMGRIPDHAGLPIEEIRRRLEADKVKCAQEVKLVHSIQIQTSTMRMKLKKLSITTRNILATLTIFRRFQFTPEELFIDILKDSVLVRVTVDDISAAVDVRDTVHSMVTKREVADAMAWWNDEASNEEKVEVMESANIPVKELVDGLITKGVHPRWLPLELRQ